jgi:excisionase family DNA binding protein
MTQLLRVGEVAVALGVCEKTVRRLIDAGELPATRVGRLVRVKASAVGAFIAAHSSDGARTQVAHGECEEADALDD